MDEEEDVVRDESRLRPHLRSEEIRRGKDLHVSLDELLPRRGLLSLRYRRKTVTANQMPTPMRPRHIVDFI